MMADKQGVPFGRVIEWVQLTAAEATHRPPTSFANVLLSANVGANGMHERAVLQARKQK